MIEFSEMFLYFAQVEKYKVFREGCTRHPDNWVPDFEKAYKNFVSESQSSLNVDVLSQEVFLILRKFITADFLHPQLLAYINAEKELRLKKQSLFNFDLDLIESELKKVLPLFRTQYTGELKSELKSENIPEYLLTKTGGQIVRLKDYLFFPGRTSEIPTVEMLDHYNRPVVGFD